MSRRLLRGACVAVTAAAALATACPWPAGADPLDPPVGPTAPDTAPLSPGPDSADAGAAGLATGTGTDTGTDTEAGTGTGTGTSDATTGTASGPVAGSGSGSGQEVAALLTRLRGLYQRAEEATEAYNGTAAALRARETEERRLGDGLGQARNSLAAARAQAGRLARSQYQGADGISPYARMLLSGTPERALEQRRLAVRETRHRAAVLARLAGAEQQAARLAGEARKALDTQQVLAARQKEQRDAVAAQLGEVQRLLASLSEEQISRLAERERTEEAGAQRRLVDSGRLGSPAEAAARTPSAAGGSAVEFATRQIGKPYVWGAEGPGSFDCSGLTSRAWAHAGRSIPRTSQEQWARLPRVPLDRLRPGDLVVYFPKATHVAIYLGDGKVVQAPRPGARVKVSPLAANPLLGAVRPDPAGVPLPEGAYTPPELPGGAAAGDDTGYSAESAPSA
ncbi:NlpC/P60 family protein [Streptomyces sp. NPDC097619]|uniref:C40 family peptidase n=1 Tax=Streptomyces sp. NPDC097619 TaxID=3157228 RepID=UPI0033252378